MSTDQGQHEKQDGNHHANQDASANIPRPVTEDECDRLRPFTESFPWYICPISGRKVNFPSSYYEYVRNQHRALISHMVDTFIDFVALHTGQSYSLHLAPPGLAVRCRTARRPTRNRCATKRPKMYLNTMHPQDPNECLVDTRKRVYRQADPSEPNCPKSAKLAVAATLANRTKMVDVDAENDQPGKSSRRNPTRLARPRSMQDEVDADSDDQGQPGSEKTFKKTKRKRISVVTSDSEDSQFDAVESDESDEYDEPYRKHRR